ncbi:MAG: HAD-IIA family hydrolase [Prevotella sp.]|nr:HAD-IIA family hydrolase [Prevotella sp.]
MDKLKEIELFLLDMDGTIYHENELISGALDFFHLLQEQGKKYVFMTNNSSKGKITYIEKLTKLGIEATEDNIASSVNATVRYLNQHKRGAKIYLIGTDSLKKELLNEGFDVVPVNYREPDVDYVLLGFDTELNYEKVVGGCYYISRGYEYIATNCDLRCPVKGNKYIPDCGSMAHMIADATERMPQFLGKPERVMVDAVSEKWGVPVEKIATVGDRLYTDVQVGINAGSKTICVLTGEATEDEMKQTGIYPTYTFPSIKELYEALK